MKLFEKDFNKYIFLFILLLILSSLFIEKSYSKYIQFEIRNNYFLGLKYFGVRINTFNFAKKEFFIEDGWKVKKASLKFIVKCKNSCKKPLEIFFNGNKVFHLYPSQKLTSPKEIRINIKRKFIKKGLNEVIYKTNETVSCWELFAVPGNGLRSWISADRGKNWDVIPYNKKVSFGEIDATLTITALRLKHPFSLWRLSESIPQALLLAICPLILLKIMELVFIPKKRKLSYLYTIIFTEVIWGLFFYFSKYSYLITYIFFIFSISVTFSHLIAKKQLPKPIYFFIALGILSFSLHRRLEFFKSFNDDLSGELKVSKHLQIQHLIMLQHMELIKNHF